MKRVFSVALGVLTAIGGFVDAGDLVTNAAVGARFGLALAWVVVLGVIGITIFAHMAGTVMATSGRSMFEVIRERLGPRAAAANLIASFMLTLLTLVAEVGGMALALQLMTGVAPVAWFVLAALAVWLTIWAVKFTTMENVAGLTGLSLLVFVVAFLMGGPDWGQVGSQLAQHEVDNSSATYWYYAVALFGAAMTPYEVFFFSSGAAEEKWSADDLVVSGLNASIGFPLGGLLSLAIAGSASLVLLPRGIEVGSMSQIVLPVAVELGTAGLIVAMIGILAATAGAALETALSCGYSLAQFVGWPWGKRIAPARAPQFHLTIIVCLLLAVGVLLTGIDPILVTEYAVVFSAVALPLTYGPVLTVANDPQYVGEHVTGRLMNIIGFGYLALITVAALAAVPLAIASRMGA
jgi:Mn2+/Fe2+ NRAMP family transporter